MKRKKQDGRVSDLLLLILIVAAVMVCCLIVREMLPYLAAEHYQKQLAEEMITEPHSSENRGQTGGTSFSAADNQPGDAGSDSLTMQTDVYPDDMYRTVDWDALKAKNDDICGWIYIPKIDADYPVLACADQRYLHLDADGQYRFSGSIFTWSASDADIGTEHCVIYGHNMADNTMFGALDQLQSGDTVYIYTPDRCCREYAVYENEVVGESDSVFQKGWRDVKRKQVLTLSTCPSGHAAASRRIVNAEQILLKLP